MINIELIKPSQLHSELLCGKIGLSPKLILGRALENIETFKIRPILNADDHVCIAQAIGLIHLIWRSIRPDSYVALIVQ